jgi:hypothetical protein
MTDGGTRVDSGGDDLRMVIPRGEGDEGRVEEGMREGRTASASLNSEVLEKKWKSGRGAIEERGVRTGKEGSVENGEGVESGSRRLDRGEGGELELYSKGGRGRESLQF